MPSPVRRTRALLFGALAVAAASATSWFAWRVVTHYEDKLEAARTVEGSRPVVVAVRDLRAGLALTAEDVRVEERVVGLDSEHLLARTEDAVGQVVGDHILAGEAVRDERLVNGGAVPRINEILDNGSRAVTVRASRATAVGGLLEPGYYVDVIVTIRPDTDTLSADWVTETILQGVRVLAVGEAVSRSPVEEEKDKKGDAERDASQPSRESWVTLEVEPAEAEELALAAARGQLHLSLRARDDFELVATNKPLVTNALVGLSEPVKAAQEKRLERKREYITRVVYKQAPPSAPPPPPVVHTTEIIRSGEVTTERFDDQGNRLPSKGQR